MPALSPTMTEGNIATWKLKEGDSFSAGDVLLEIETDKAQMDVEAQDDGILAKIIQGDGSKAVQVGTRIGVTAEPGDDLSSLEIPEEDSPAPKKAEASKEQPKEESKKESEPVPKEERTASPAQSDAPKKSSSGKATKQTYPLYPSVQHLLEINGLPKEEADKIPASGPNGRLLKGDVLAYVGKIQDSYPSELAQRFEKLAHLDLSNIKPAAKKESPKKPAAVAEAALAVEDLDIEVALPISLTAVVECQKRVKDSIGVFLPLSTFVARAAELANEDLPKSKTAKPSADELFNAVLGLDKVAGKQYSRGRFVPQMTVLPPTTLSSYRAPASKKSDVLDILSGKRSAHGSKASSVGGADSVVGPLNVFSVSVPKGDEKRGRVFLERVKSVLEVEPGRLVV
ncbi:pyridoxine biosynthesis protein [Neocucurbitaria cava]|uniref:Pyridoxine biosynthesis protein n=1 Tax=Neocucurbitaria cava TaxID=798079 RepID=A0A9W9CP33_9PLEO|nr:pyridoxine biosynthesis protein [Neocucurbitaria cava]